jgi:hypothetical protein
MARGIFALSYEPRIEPTYTFKFRYCTEGGLFEINIHPVEVSDMQREANIAGG